MWPFSRNKEERLRRAINYANERISELETVLVKAGVIKRAPFSPGFTVPNIYLDGKEDVLSKTRVAFAEDRIQTAEELLTQITEYLNVEVKYIKPKRLLVKKGRNKK